MAKKPKSYPKKFRQKMEKVAEARDEREAKTDDDDAFLKELHAHLFGTMFQDFLLPESVDLIVCPMPEHMQPIAPISTAYMIKRTPRTAYFYDGKPPWEPD